MKLIDKDALVSEIQKLDALCHLSKNLSGELFIEGLFRFLDTSEVKEVDLDKDIEKEIDEVFFQDTLGHTTEKLTHKRLSIIAKHFFELGLQARKEEAE